VVVVVLQQLSEAQVALVVAVQGEVAPEPMEPQARPTRAVAVAVLATMALLAALAVLASSSFPILVPKGQRVALSHQAAAIQFIHS
jgi:hypothetical protein